MLKTARNLVLVGLLSNALCASYAVASDSAPREATVVVSGEGEAATAPDQALMMLTVLRQAKTADEALALSSKAMTEVLADIKSQGIDEKDVQTTDFSIQLQYAQPSPDGNGYAAPEIVGYAVSNGLNIRVRDLAKLGAVIDRAVKLGVNQGGNITFTNDNPDATIEEARKKAVAKAQAKARTLAEAAGVKLGRVVEISESYSQAMPQMFAAPMAKMAAAEAMPMPVASGENRYVVTVSMTYALEQ